MNIPYLLMYLWKKKWIIIIPTLVAVIIAWFFSSRQTQTYTSMAELSTGYMDASPLNNTSANLNNTVLFNNVLQSLQSNDVLDQVSYKLLLHDLDGKEPFRKSVNTQQANQILARYPGGKPGLIIALNNKIDSFYVLDLAKDNDRMIRELADIYGYSPNAILESVQMRRIEGSDFITVTSTADDPKLSAFIPNAICRTFLALYQNRQGMTSSASLDTLKNMVDTKKLLLDNKLKLLQGGGDLAVSNSFGMLGNMQGQLTQQKANLIAAQVALENVNAQISEAGKKGGLANNEDIIYLRNNIDNLWEKYVNNGSNDVALLGQINKLRNDLQQKLSALGSNVEGGSLSDLMKQKMELEVKVNVANQTMADIQSKINSLNNAVQSSTSQEGIVQGVQNEIEVARQDYVNANNLYNEALNRNIFPGNNFKQALVASPPLYSNPSKKLKVIGLAGAGVFFSLIFLFLFFEFIDSSIKTPSYLKDNVPLPLLANLQRINLKKSTVKDIFLTEDLLTKEKRSFREQIKQLRFEVENSESRIFIIAGYHSGIGRTTLIQALANSLSLNNKKVLLIDANFQNNTLSKLYNADASVETFNADGDLNEVKKKIEAVKVSTNDTKVELIGCGSGSYTPSEVLPLNNLFAYFRRDKGDYDYIFIDCASISKGPDNKELIKYADSIILMFSADEILSDEDKELVEFFKREQVNVLGAVLNKVNSYNIDL